MHVDVIVNAANSAWPLEEGSAVRFLPQQGIRRWRVPAGSGRLSHRTGSDDRRVCTASAGGDPHGGPHLARGRGGRGRASGHAAIVPSLTLAAEAGFRSIAFPLISAGIYGYPLKQALEIAVSSMQAFLAEHEMQVYLTVLEEKLIPLAESFLRRKGEEV